MSNLKSGTINRDMAILTRLAAGALAAFLLALPSNSLLANPQQVKAEGVLLAMPEPPADYIVTKRPIDPANPRVGAMVLVTKEGSLSKVLITVETAVDRSARAARVAATKAYVNALASGLSGAGMELTTKSLPDVEKATFVEPVMADMTFAKQGGDKLYTRLIIFFTNKGFDVQIIADNQTELELLTSWAKLIKPASSKTEESAK